MARVPRCPHLLGSKTIDLVKNTAVLPHPAHASPLPTGGLTLPKAFPATKVPPPSDFHEAGRLGGSKETGGVPDVHPGD